ncbi:HalOD1 output domain-containing protein [Halorarius litoreus]|uniref:HalOD1 output domain-containing protein n=1 Tax=Halorarius litoreus TaxID=2962676 RepID=UPI0020CCEC85|nr:HalOD1 output domain-containing protein [Halorarius litoreus]
MSDTNTSEFTSMPSTPSPIVPPDEQLVHEERVEFGGPSELVVTIVEVIADVRNCSPTDLLPGIHESVDTDGLERVFRPHPGAPNRQGWVTFFFCGCRVVVTADGTLGIFDRRAGR